MPIPHTQPLHLKLYQLFLLHLYITSLSVSRILSLVLAIFILHLFSLRILETIIIPRGLSSQPHRLCLMQEHVHNQIRFVNYLLVFVLRPFF